MVNNTIVVSEAYTMEGNEDCTWAGRKIKGEGGWYASNTNFTHFVIIELVNPFDPVAIGHFKVVSAGAPDGNKGTVGAGDKATLIFAWNQETGEASAPVTVSFGPSASSWGTGWKLNLDFSALKK